MKPPELIELLKGLDQEKELLCQVVALDGKAWMMQLKVSKPPHVSFNVLTLEHPDLLTLPDSAFRVRDPS